MIESEASRDFRAEVIGQRSVAPDHHIISLRPLGLSSPPAPRAGQFYLLGTGDGLDPLLKRPLCFFNSDGDTIEFLYRVRGKGTAILSNLQPGSVIPVLGPLGNGYPISARDTDALIVAGGTAVASVYQLILGLGRKARVVYGARGRDDLFMLDEIKSATRELYLSTNDGSVGTQGTVLDVLRTLEIARGTTIYACGPRGLIAGVQAFAEERKLKGWASLEEFMACGIGACMGCVCKTRSGYKRVCKEGPVFPLSEVSL